MVKIISKIIEPDETIVRCLLESYLKSSKSQVPTYKALEPKVNEDDVSMLRLDYTDEAYCISYGQGLSGPSSFKGLLYISPRIVDSVNQWARSGISAEELSGGRDRNGISTRLVYSPLDKNKDPLPLDVDLSNDTSNGDCPMHCDLLYSERRIDGGQEEVLNTRIRKYAVELSGRVKYQISNNTVTGGLETMEQEAVYNKYNETPILSIIIPFNKAKDYIIRLANSLLPQTQGKPVEVIFINDEDPESFKLLKPFIEKYPRELVYFGQKNKGLAVTRNRGIELARGGYLWFVDVDDVVAEGAVDSILEQIKLVSKDVFVFRMDDYDRKGHLVKNTRSFYLGNEPKDYDGISLILDHLSYSPVQMCILKRQFMVDNNLRFVELAPHDLELMPRLMLQADEIRLVPKTIYHYYHNYDLNHKGKYSSMRTENLLVMLDQYDAMIKKTEDARKRKALYITQFRLLRHILHDPDKKAFEKKYSNWGIKERMPQIRRILFNNFHTINSLRAFTIWSLWFLSPRLYKILQFRGKYSPQRS